MASIAVKLPLTRDSVNGWKMIVGFKALIKQNIKMLLLTVPGERVMFPDYGVGLKTYLFSNFSGTVYAEIEDKINQAEASWRKPGENSSGPISCFDSLDNQERRHRAEKLALHHHVTAHNIAAAWTMNQPFPSYALVGPRTINEIDSTLPCLNIELSESDVKWLNLQEEKNLK